MDALFWLIFLPFRVTYHFIFYVLAFLIMWIGTPILMFALGLIPLGYFFGINDASMYPYIALHGVCAIYWWIAHAFDFDSKETLRLSAMSWLIDRIEGK